jgi:glutathione S-transferase
MAIVSLAIMLSILEFMVLGGMVGRARSKYGVKAPATTGNEMFERHFRVHYNTLEHLIVFIPAVWFFGQYVSPTWAAALGALFIVSRVVYAVGYVRDPGKREAGAILSFVASTPLVLGALYGIIRAVFV